MIALAVGLIVSFAVISFIASLLQTNSLTIQSTRLNQELRTISELVARELRRARSMRDPLVNMGQGADDPATVGVIEGAQNPWQSLVIVGGDCIQYAYEDAPGGEFRAIRREEAGGVGTVVLARDGDPVDCDSAGTTINSDLVDITALEFAFVGTDRVDLRVVARLIGNDDIAPKEFRTSIFVRSGNI